MQTKWRKIFKDGLKCIRLRKRLKRVVKGRHWTYAERKKVWKHYKLNDYTPCKIKFRLYLPHTNTII